MASGSCAGGDSEVLLLLEEYCSHRRSTGTRSYCGVLHLQGPDDSGESQSRSSAVDRLVQITDSAPVPKVYVESQDEIVQKLVNLMITFGDDINQKITQNPLLQQQLSNMNYDLFEKVTSTVQNLVDSGQVSECEEEVQQKKIAWAFEVTSRLSVVGVVQRRRLLSFGDRYIQQHHSAWVQEHGGWDEVFAVD
ncbi:hypothetical protein INR49_020638 [Caranx melampygus]|nr:hypothetical protein INR49_020638 [Caranx melampygus]